MIYKNQRLLSLHCSKDLNIRKRASQKKTKSPPRASINARSFIINHNKIFISEARQESTEGNFKSGNSPSSTNTPIILFLVFLFITIFVNNYNFSTHETRTESESHGYDLHKQMSLKQHHFYHFFHRTRYKPGQPSSLPTIQPTGQPTGRPSSFHTSQP